MVIATDFYLNVHCFRNDKLCRHVKSTARQVAVRADKTLPPWVAWTEP